MYFFCRLYISDDKFRFGGRERVFDEAYGVQSSRFDVMVYRCVVEDAFPNAEVDRRAEVSTPHPSRPVIRPLSHILDLCFFPSAHSE